MTIPAATIAAYAPIGNATLAFEVPTGAVTTDPTTGNATTATELVEYLAVLQPAQPFWQAQAGADNTAYSVSGRLLSPAVLDPRITNGSLAEANINGLRGRFELAFTLSMNRGAYGDLRQPISGTFRVVGGP